MQDAGQVEPAVADPDPLAGPQPVDAEPRRGGRAEHGERLAGGDRVEVAAARDARSDGGWQLEAGRLHGDGVGVNDGDERAAVDVRAADRPRELDRADAADAGDHAGSGGGEFGGLAGQRLSVGDGQQVGPEPVDLGQQTGLRRRRQAEHGDDRGDPDRDAQGRERGAQLAREQPDRGQPAEVAEPQPAGGERRGHGAVSATTRPSSISIRRGSRVAIARSCVITTIVAPAALSSSSSAMRAFAGGAVQVAGGLVGEHDRRPVDQRAGDRHPLALAAGELRRPGRRAVGEADGGQRLERATAAQSDRRARVEQAVGDVVQRGRVLGQEELLEDEADAGGAQRGELPVGQARDVEPGHLHAPGAGTVERAQQVQQRRLPGPGRADDRHQLTLADGEADLAQRGDRRAAGIGLGHLLDSQNRAHDGTTTRCPAASPDPVTCTSSCSSSNSPRLTITRWCGSATSTA